MEKTFIVKKLICKKAKHGLYCYISWVNAKEGRKSSCMKFEEASTATNRRTLICNPMKGRLIFILPIRMY